MIGGSGFIGTHLVRLLLQSGHEVRIVDKNRSEAYPELSSPCDVRDRARLESACEGGEVLFNLAAEHRDDVRPISLYDEVNTGGAKNVCEVAEAIGCERIVFTSSVAVYGFCDSQADESSETQPFNDYGRTKLDAERVFRRWVDHGSGRSLVIVRPTVVFGEGNRGNVYNLLSQIVNGPFLMIGDGANRKSMAYVENVASFLRFSLSFGPGIHIYNYVDKPDYDMNGLVSAVQAHLGRAPKFRLRVPLWLGYVAGRLLDSLALLLRRPMPLSYVRVQKFVSFSVFSSEKMMTSGFRPLVPLPEALLRTADHEFGER